MISRLNSSETPPIALRYICSGTTSYRGYRTAISWQGEDGPIVAPAPTLIDVRANGGLNVANHGLAFRFPTAPYFWRRYLVRTAPFFTNVTGAEPL